MKVHMAFEFGDDQRRLLRAAQGRGGMATRNEFKAFVTSAVGAGLVGLRAAAHRGADTTDEALTAAQAAGSRTHSLTGCTSLDHIYPNALQGTPCYCGERKWGAVRLRGGMKQEALQPEEGMES